MNYPLHKTNKEHPGNPDPLPFQLLGCVCGEDV